MNKTKKNLILLSEIGQNLINNENIKEKELKSPLIVLAKNIKDLKGLLPNSMPVFKVYRDLSGMIRYLTLGIYQQDNKPVVVCPNLNADILESFKIESFKIYNNLTTATIRYQETSLIVPIALSDEGRIYALDNPSVEDIGSNLNPILLKEVPKLEVPLRNLSTNIIYTIIGTGKKSGKYNTPLIDIQDESGKQIKNVLCNNFLSLYADISKQFKITEIVEQKRKSQIGTKKDGTPKYETKIITIVNICPVNESSEASLINL